MSPAGSIAQQLLLNIELRKFIDPSRLSLESFEIERLRADPIRIVGLQSFEKRGIDVAYILTLEYRAIPGLVARDAFVDEPRVELSPIGIEPDPVAALEGSEASASAARDPGLRGDLGSDGPADLKCIAHAVLVFRSEVHQDGGVRKPLRHGMALFGDDELRQRGCTWHETMPNRSHAATR